MIFDFKDKAATGLGKPVAARSILKDPGPGRSASLPSRSTDIVVNPGATRGDIDSPNEPGAIGPFPGVPFLDAREPSSHFFQTGSSRLREKQAREQTMMIEKKSTTDCRSWPESH